MQRTVVVPPELGYGKKGMNEIPVNADTNLWYFLLNLFMSFVKKLHIISNVVFQLGCMSSYICLIFSFALQPGADFEMNVELLEVIPPGEK